MKKVICLIFLLLFGIFLVNADSNGIWNYAEDIRGGIFGNDEGVQSYIFNNSLNTNLVQEYGNSGIQFKNSSGFSTVYISNTGNVGIGTLNPTQALDVNGNIEATAYYYDSDIRLKKNISKISNALEIVEKLEGVNFIWKENDKASIGLIAQDVEFVLPELVNTKDDGYKSVEYGNLVAVLIEAIKEQQAEIEELQSKLQE